MISSRAHLKPNPFDDSDSDHGSYYKDNPFNDISGNAEINQNPFGDSDSENDPYYRGNPFNDKHGGPTGIHSASRADDFPASRNPFSGPDDSDDEDVGVVAKFIVDGCCLVLQHAQPSPQSSTHIVSGTLQILALLLAGDNSTSRQANRFVFAVVEHGSTTLNNERNFYYPLLEDSQFCIEHRTRCIAFPAYVDDGIYALVVPRSSDLTSLSNVLKELGCTVDASNSAAAIRCATAMEWGGQVGANGIRRGATALRSNMSKGANVVKRSSALAPKEKPIAVPQAVGVGVGGARQGTRCVAVLSGALVNGISSAAVFMAQQAATQGKPTSPGGSLSAKVSGGGSTHVKDVKVVGTSTFRAAGDVYKALKEAAGNIGEGIADTSSDLVGHKYGEQAGGVTRNLFHTAGNLLHIKTTPMGIARAAALDTAKKLSQKDEPLKNGQQTAPKGMPLTAAVEIVPIGL